MSKGQGESGSSEDRLRSFDDPSIANDLGSSAARGAALMVLNSILSKILSFACQIGIAWFLSPDELGVVSLTMTVALLLITAQSTGLRTVLVQRHEDFDKIQNSAFWLSVALGLAGSMLCLLAGPVAAKIYGDQRLVGNCALAAVALLFNPISIVVLAGLQIHLRFRSLVIIALVETLGYQPGILLLAWLGFGPKAFFLAWAFVAAAKFIVANFIMPLPIRFRPELSLWRGMIGNSVLVIVARVLYSFNMQANYILIGIFFPSDAAGYLFFAANLALQPVFFLSGNLETVLLPTLTKFGHHADRQREAFLKAIRLLAAAAFPISYVAAAIADPLMRLLFDRRWEPGIPIFMVLCLGVPFLVVGNVSHTILQAQGRFRYYLRVSMMLPTILLPLTLAAILLSNAQDVAFHVAIATAVAFAIQGVLVLVLSLRPGRLSITELMSTIGRPMSGSALGLIGGLSATHFCRLWEFPTYASFLVSLAAALFAAFVGMRLFAPSVTAELVQRMRRTLKSNHKTGTMQNVSATGSKL